MNKTGFLFGVCACLAAGRAIAAPPPPAPVWVAKISEQLVHAQTAATFKRYADLMADDLKVTIDGKRVASNKEEWLAIERGSLSKGSRQLIAYADNGGDLVNGVFRHTIMVIDRFDDRSDIAPGDAGYYDRRYKTRALKYTLGDDRRVHAIDVLQGGGNLVTP